MVAKRSLNLLPARFRRRRLVRRCAAGWAIATAAAVTPVLALVCIDLSERNSLREAVAERGRRYRPAILLDEGIRRMTIEEPGVRAERQRLQASVGGERPLDMIGFVGRGAGECEGRIQIRQFTVGVTHSETPAAGAVKPADGENVEVSLRGLGADESAVAEFVNRLRDTGGFGAVELRSSSSQTTEGREAASFQIECRIGGEHVPVPRG
jgi:hypothetical protein